PRRAAPPARCRRARSRKGTGGARAGRRGRAGLSWVATSLVGGFEPEAAPRGRVPGSSVPDSWSDLLVASRSISPCVSCGLFCLRPPQGKTGKSSCASETTPQAVPAAAPLISPPARDLPAASLARGPSEPAGVAPRAGFVGPRAALRESVA